MCVGLLKFQNESGNKFIAAVYYRPDATMYGIIRIQLLSDLADNIRNSSIAIPFRLLPDRLINLLLAEYPAWMPRQIAESKKFVVTHGNGSTALADNLLPHMDFQVTITQYGWLWTTAAVCDPG